MKEETFDYSKVPHNFGLCATDTCPYTDTCLRQIAYTYAPSNNIFLYVLNPKAIESTAGKCKLSYPDIGRHIYKLINVLLL